MKYLKKFESCPHLKETVYLEEGELVDTYGGDYTYRDVWYEIEEDGSYSFYTCCYGAKEEPNELVTDPEEIEMYMSQIKNSK